MPYISIVIPVKDEAQCLEELIERLLKLQENSEDTYEYLFINDGSSDSSLDILKNFAKKRDSIKYVSFSRNFGHESATTAGLDHAKGDAVVIIDADLQDPPELIPVLVEKWKEGYQVVYAQRKSRKGEHLLTKLTSWFFYRTLRLISNVEIPLDTGDFRLIDRCVVEQLAKCREHHRFVRGLIAWTGFKQTSVLYDRDKRRSGSTKYNFLKRTLLALDAFVGFSIVPLRIAVIIGIIVCFFSFIMMCVIIFQKLFLDVSIPGYALLTSGVFFLSGVQLLLVGLVGEYVGRIYSQAQKRPLYIISEKSQNLSKGVEDKE